MRGHDSKQASTLRENISRPEGLLEGSVPMRGKHREPAIRYPRQDMPRLGRFESLPLRERTSLTSYGRCYGIDLDTGAIRIAKERQGELPLTYEASDNIKHLEGTIKTILYIRSQRFLKGKDSVPKHVKLIK